MSAEQVALGFSFLNEFRPEIDDFDQHMIDFVEIRAGKQLIESGYILMKISEKDYVVAAEKNNPDQELAIFKEGM